ncbi:Histidine Kinase [Marinomonas sp. MED121]|uniref:sensor histidine kinase n=1 Tax=Marinomonas sp. MED121 TaxID=314277 RepID=UPI0000690C1E|nr:sensor histidine kinase [Marinomonas sp. MED121]EAQ64859.1 Histidine Kinase [Marinomonas sp. MED121]
MDEDKLPHHTLKFAPSILSRLGEELLPNFDQGIIELVRNAYDADAQNCTVTLNNINHPGGSIVIEDDGCGMDEDVISKSWLVLGHSSKRESGVTNKGRIQVGDKGLGRLAALRMGKNTILTSRPRLPESLVHSDKEYQTQLEWSLFNKTSTVDEVAIEITSSVLTPDSHAGTKVEILNLNKKITKPEAERLARSLMLLSNPFDEVNDFKLNFVCNDYPELEKLVRTGYLNEAEFVLKAKLDSNGMATAQVLDWKRDVIWRTNSDEWFSKKSSQNSPIYNAPSSDFEISIFQLDNSTFATRNINKTQVSNWLKSVGGVHIYHNEFRVHPYGDEGSDWLDMNLARVNNPSIRPSTNTSIGRVNILDKDKVLQQKTDRVGFIEDDTFHELKRFIIDSLNWYANKRNQLATQKRNAQKDKDEKEVKDKNLALKKVIQSVESVTSQKKLKAAVKAASLAAEKQTKHLKEDLKLYRSLATAGTTTAVFSHEVSKPISEIPHSLNSAEKLVKINCEPSIYSRYKERTNNILSYLDRLSHFAELQLNLLKRNKRRDGVIDINSAIENLLIHFKPLLNRELIEVEFIYDNSTKPKLNGSLCILEAIITNCLTNSMKAFRSDGFDVDTRKIEILVKQSSQNLLIRISDNGPGITEISTEDIWLPGVTTVEDGTGFGLTIVRDSVSDLGGSCRLDAKGSLGGATFYFEFVAL